MRHATSTLLAFLLFAIPTLAAEKQKKEPKAPPPRQQVTPLSDVTDKIDAAIGAIDRDKLTEAKANQQLALAIKAFNSKRFTVSVSFKINDVRAANLDT